MHLSYIAVLSLIASGVRALADYMEVIPSFLFLETQLVTFGRGK